MVSTKIFKAYSVAVNIFISAMLIFMPSSASASSVWDLRADWSDLTNPNIPWSYNNDNTPLPRAPQVLGLPQGGWSDCPTCRGFWILASVTQAGSDWQIGDVVTHTQDQFSDPYSHASNVTWTSPITGNINVTGNLWMDNAIPDRGSQWNVYVKGVLVSSGQLSGSDQYSRSNPFAIISGTGGNSPLTNVPVGIGDVVKLEIVRTTVSGFWVGTNLTVSTVPEPGSSCLFIVGATLLSFAIRRGNRNGQIPKNAA